jgi:hypothetical protein
MAFPVVRVVAYTYSSYRLSSHLSNDELLLYSSRAMTMADGVTEDEHV